VFTNFAKWFGMQLNNYQSHEKLWFIEPLPKCFNILLSHSISLDHYLFL